jgi:hypothetical protein
VFFVNLSRGVPYKGTQHSIVEVHHFLNSHFIGKDTMFVVVDWGLYSLQALYGPKNQSVVYTELPQTPEFIQKIHELCNSSKRRPIFIGRTDSAERWIQAAQQVYPGLSAQPKYHPSSGVWGVWYE